MREVMIRAVHPGEILSEGFLEPLGISRYRLAKETFMDISRVSEIVKGERGITADAALRLSQFFDTPPEFWSSLQMHYELELKRRELADELRQIRKHDRKEEPPKAEAHAKKMWLSNGREDKTLKGE